MGNTVKLLHYTLSYRQSALVKDKYEQKGNKENKIINHIKQHTMSPGKFPNPAKHITAELTIKAPTF